MGTTYDLVDLKNHRRFDVGKWGWEAWLQELVVQKNVPDVETFLEHAELMAYGDREPYEEEKRGLDDSERRIVRDLYPFCIAAEGDVIVISEHVTYDYRFDESWPIVGSIYGPPACWKHEDCRGHDPGRLEMARACWRSAHPLPCSARVDEYHERRGCEHCLMFEEDGEDSFFKKHEDSRFPITDDVMNRWREGVLGNLETRRVWRRPY